MPHVESRVVESGGPAPDLFALADVEQERGRRGRERVRIVDRPEHGGAGLGPQRLGQPPGRRDDRHGRATSATIALVRRLLMPSGYGCSITSQAAT